MRWVRRGGAGGHPHEVAVGSDGPALVRVALVEDAAKLVLDRLRRASVVRSLQQNGFELMPPNPPDLTHVHIIELTLETLQRFLVQVRGAFVDETTAGAPHPRKMRARTEDIVAIEAHSSTDGYVKEQDMPGQNVS